MRGIWVFLEEKKRKEYKAKNYPAKPRKSSFNRRYGGQPENTDSDLSVEGEEGFTENDYIEFCWS